MATQRIARIAIVGVAVAGFLLSAAGQAIAASSNLKVKAYFESTGVDPDAKGWIEWRSQKDRLRFRVQTEKLDAGDYDIAVGGVVIGLLSVHPANSGNKMAVEFRNPAEAGKPLFEVDPRGQLVTIERAAVVYLQVVLPNTPASPGNSAAAKAPKLKIKVNLEATGADPDASGKLDWRSQSGFVRMKVEVEDLDPGLYDLSVGGVIVGVIEVVALDAGGSEGEIEFRNPVESGELLLDFDPRGQLVTVESGGTVLLQVVVPTL